MIKKQYKTIAIAILACWLFLAISFVAGRLAPNISSRTSSPIELNSEGHENEVPGPFTLKAVSTFLMQ